jgi:hypothetical protein
MPRTAIRLRRLVLRDAFRTAALGPEETTGSTSLLTERITAHCFFKVVARDGIEPPTPAFSGPRSTTELSGLPGKGS